MLENCLKFIAPSVALCGISLAFAAANPASKFCVEEQKGSLEIVQTEAGETGVCKLEGSRIEEWTLFRRVNGGQVSKAVTAFCSHQKPDGTSVDQAKLFYLPNPAALFCIKVGGQVVGGGLCQFQEGEGEEKSTSAIGQWTLFYGSEAPINAKLTQLICS